LAILIEKQFDGSAVRLNYAEGPEGGSPLLLLHGFTDRWQTWLDVIPALMLRWHVYALDHRGHGQSGRTRGGYARTSYASDATEFLRGIVGRPAALVGHSLGAGTAISVATSSPELVTALVLEEPRLLTPSDEASPGVTTPFVEECERLAAGMGFEEIRELERRLYPEANPAESRERARHLSCVDPAVLRRRGPPEQPDAEPVLARIQVPALLIHGERELGGIVSESGAERAASEIRDLTVVKIDGIGHDIHWRRPNEFRSIVVDFLESLERSARP